MNQDADDAGLSPDREALNSDLEGDPEDDKMVSTVTVEEQLKAESNGSLDNATTTNGRAKLSAKDPQRPRRKKARRACHACQRAHLTCGMFIWSYSCSSSYMP
jgi:hypothetical protein